MRWTPLGDLKWQSHRERLGFLCCLPAKFDNGIAGILIERKVAFLSSLRPFVRLILYCNQPLFKIDMAKGRRDEF